MAQCILNNVLDGIERWGDIVRVTVAHTLGSTPREAGADMIVGSNDFSGTIGGGKLEHLALQKARALLEGLPIETGTWPRMTENFVLGTELRQCCGGVAWLLFERFGVVHRETLETLRQRLEPGSMLARNVTDHSPLMHDRAMPDLGCQDSEAVLLKDESGKPSWFVEPAFRQSAPLVVYGAGHVGRALVRVLQDTPFDITWVDIDRDRFPKDIGTGIKTVVTATPAEFAKTVEADAFHVVMTHSHSIDLDICRSVLDTGVSRYLGLIASKTKRAKFRNRLQNEGLPDQAFNVFHSPIGMGNWSSKQPAVIAISIAAELVDVYEEELVIQRRDVLREIRTVGETR